MELPLDLRDDRLRWASILLLFPPLSDNERRGLCQSLRVSLLCLPLILAVDLMLVFFSGDGRSSDSDEIVLIVVAVDVVVVIFVVVVDNMIIAVAAAEADELPFNFSTSRRTCICSVRLTASSSEYPFTLKTLGILSRPVGSGLYSHATKRSAAFLARASAQFFGFPEDIKIEK